MATAIEANSPPNASACCWLTPASSTVTPAGIVPTASSASISAWTDCDTAPVSSLVISPLIVAAGASLTRVMLPWTSVCTTVATSASGTVRTVPTGRASRSSTEVVAAGSTWTMSAIGLPGSKVTVVAVVATRADRPRPRPGRGDPDGDGLVRVDGDLDLGRGLDEVALEVDDPGVSWSASRTATEASSTSTESGPLTTTVSPLEVKPPAEPTITS